MAATALPAVSLMVLSVVALQCAAAVRQWRFDVTADGVPIGTHQFVVDENDGTRSVRSEMHFRVRVLLVDAYRYDHRATERWQNDCLAQIESHTDERDRVIDVKGHLEANHFEIDSAAGHSELPACVMTFAYWNPNVLKQSHLVNAQTGAWTPVKIEALGSDVIDVRGQPRKANRYRIRTEKNQIELWYADNDGEWLSMRATTNEGHTLAYRLQ